MYLYLPTYRGGNHDISQHNVKICIEKKAIHIDARFRLPYIDTVPKSEGFSYRV